jgi:hypothetical protein
MHGHFGKNIDIQGIGFRGMIMNIEERDDLENGKRKSSIARRKNI